MQTAQDLTTHDIQPLISPIEALCDRLAAVDIALESLWYDLQKEGRDNDLLFAANVEILPELSKAKVCVGRAFDLLKDGAE